jgi:hypothetical protein
MGKKILFILGLIFYNSIISMNDKINIDRTSNATMSNLNIERVERNQEIKTNVSYNDRIEIS